MSEVLLDYIKLGRVCLLCNSFIPFSWFGIYLSALLMAFLIGFMTIVCFWYLADHRLGVEFTDLPLPRSLAKIMVLLCQL